jgi:crossover junction endodeoxyribonuclease RuvC
MKILGLDPGSRWVGYALVETDGERTNFLTGGVLSSSVPEFSGRLKDIYDRLCAIIGEHQPEQIAVESVFLGRNVQAAINMGAIWGIVLLAAENRDVAVYSYTPGEVKRTVVGHGRAHKSQVQQMVKMHLRLKELPRPQHVADAAAVALCHCFHLR